jgi:hypothetical protein
LTIASKQSLKKRQVAITKQNIKSKMYEKGGKMSQKEKKNTGASMRNSDKGKVKSKGRKIQKKPRY